ncbi:AraC family transcriptional regulator [Aliikangiella sp. IMCC44359]|uniref:AraC family transcriptional regulator n=1 Tax=Aliikangiella sp. IMCC44359 TaxID=3459125 RepID=UPI00403B2E9F
MKTEYTARINRVLQYIEDNLPNKISLTEVAKVSHFSAYHFHRIFTAIVGETVNDYIARRRLERAINQLICKTELSITEVAFNNGFSSSANFSKVVKLYFGFSPSEIRKPEIIKNSKIGKITSKYGKVFNPFDLYPSHIIDKTMRQTQLKDSNMKIKVKKLENQRVCTLTSKLGYKPEGIYSTWDQLIDWANNNGIRNEEQKRFAFAYDNPTITPIDKCRYVASIVIDDKLSVNLPFETSIIPQGQYAVLYYKGSPDETLTAQLSIYSDWLPNSGFEPDNFPMLEHYLNDARVDGYLEMEIYVKLKEL